MDSERHKGHAPLQAWSWQQRLSSYTSIFLCLHPSSFVTHSLQSPSHRMSCEKLMRTPLRKAGGEKNDCWCFLPAVIGRTNWCRSEAEECASWVWIVTTRTHLHFGDQFDEDVHHRNGADLALHLNAEHRLSSSSYPWGCKGFYKVHKNLLLYVQFLADLSTI